MPKKSKTHTPRKILAIRYLDEAIVSCREDVWSRRREEDTVDKVRVQGKVLQENTQLNRPHLHRRRHGTALNNIT